MRSPLSPLSPLSSLSSQVYSIVVEALYDDNTIVSSSSACQVPQGGLPCVPPVGTQVVRGKHGAHDSKCTEFDYPVAGVWQHDHDCCAKEKNAGCAPGYTRILGTECGKGSWGVAYAVECKTAEEMSGTARCVSQCVYAHETLLAS